MTSTISSPAARIEAALIARFGTPVRVAWSWRHGALTCTRPDGFALTPAMDAMFDSLIADEQKSAIG